MAKTEWYTVRPREKGRSPLEAALNNGFERNYPTLEEAQQRQAAMRAACPGFDFHLLHTTVEVINDSSD